MEREDFQKKLKGFISSDAGQEFLEKLRQVRDSNNDLQGVVNGAGSGVSTETLALTIAVQSGFVRGIDSVITLIETETGVTL